MAKSSDFSVLKKEFSVLNKKKFISFLENSLYHMAFLDIKRACDGKSLMGAFILASCFIDYLAGFRYGKRETKRKDYTDFITEYLPEYNAKNLYSDLRCKLVHNYSEGGSYSLTDSQPALHLKKNTISKTVLNLQDFINDLEKAYNQYFKELEEKEQLQWLAFKRFKSTGLLSVKRITVKNI